MSIGITLGRGPLNVAVVAGTLSSPPQERVLPSGGRIVSYEVTVRHGSGPADTVPVAWADPPAAALGFDTGDDVIVVGRVRRRFFRAGGATSSRTEVVADAVVAARQVKRASAVLAKALEAAGGG